MKGSLIYLPIPLVVAYEICQTGFSLFMTFVVCAMTGGFADKQKCEDNCNTQCACTSESVEDIKAFFDHQKSACTNACYFSPAKPDKTISRQL